MRPTLDILFDNFIVDYDNFAGTAFIKKFGDKNEYELIFEKFIGDKKFIVYLREKIGEDKYKFLLQRLLVAIGKEHDIYSNKLKIKWKEADFDAEKAENNSIYYGDENNLLKVNKIFMIFSLFSMIFLKINEDYQAIRFGENLTIKTVHYNFRKFGKNLEYEIAFEPLLFDDKAQIAIYKQNELICEKVPVKLFMPH